MIYASSGAKCFGSAAPSTTTTANIQPTHHNITNERFSGPHFIHMGNYTLVGFQHNGSKLGTGRPEINPRCNIFSQFSTQLGRNCVQVEGDGGIFLKPTIGTQSPT